MASLTPDFRNSLKVDSAKQRILIDEIAVDFDSVSNILGIDKVRRDSSILASP